MMTIMTLMTSMMRTMVMVIVMEMVLVMVMVVLMMMVMVMGNVVFLILGKANQSVQNFDTRILHDLISAILCDSVPTRRSVASAC